MSVHIPTNFEDGSRKGFGYVKGQQGQLRLYQVSSVRRDVHIENSWDPQSDGRRQ